MQYKYGDVAPAEPLQLNLVEAEEVVVTAGGYTAANLMVMCILYFLSKKCVFYISFFSSSLHPILVNFS
jgi:hypothetical protein